MRWYELDDDDNPYHQLHVLINDKLDVLARIEVFGDISYPWIMDVKEPWLIRRVGAFTHPIRHVRTYCEKVLLGEIGQNHDTACALRPLATGVPPENLNDPSPVPPSA